MILDFKILSLWFVIEYWWYNILTGKNNWFLNALVKSNFATPTPFGRVSFFVVWVCLSNYNLNSFLIHQASYPKGNQWYLMHREVLGSIWKIGRCPIKVSEVLCPLIHVPLSLSLSLKNTGTAKEWNSELKKNHKAFYLPILINRTYYGNTPEINLSVCALKCSFLHY